MMVNRGGIMRADSVWTFNVIPGSTPTNPEPSNVAMTISADGSSVTFQPTDPASWQPHSIYITLDQPSEDA